MDKIKELLAVCNGSERFKVATMLDNAADYVRAVAVMEVAAANVADLDPDEFKEERESTDRSRSAAHNAFISSVDAVNKIFVMMNILGAYPSIFQEHMPIFLVFQ